MLWEFEEFWIGFMGLLTISNVKPTTMEKKRGMPTKNVTKTKVLYNYPKYGNI